MRNTHTTRMRVLVTQAIMIKHHTTLMRVLVTQVEGPLSLTGVLPGKLCQALTLWNFQTYSQTHPGSHVKTPTQHHPRVCMQHRRAQAVVLKHPQCVFVTQAHPGSHIKTPTQHHPRVYATQTRIGSHVITPTQHHPRVICYSGAPRQPCLNTHTTPPTCACNTDAPRQPC